MSNREQFLTTPPIDFAVILNFISNKVNRTNDNGDLASVNDFREFTLEMLNSISELSHNVVPNQDILKTNANSFIYCLLWLQSFSVNHDLSHGSSFESATTLANQMMPLVIDAANDSKLPCVITFTTVIRLYDSFHERMIDSDNIVHIMNHGGTEQIKFFLDMLEAATRIFRYMDWNYFNSLYSFG